MPPFGARAINAALAIPKIVVGGLVLLAISVMLYGVFMRYVMLPITDWLDVDPINFFWVEEVGETTLAGSPWSVPPLALPSAATSPSTCCRTASHRVCSMCSMCSTTC